MLNAEIVYNVEHGHGYRHGTSKGDTHRSSGRGWKVDGSLNKADLRSISPPYYLSRFDDGLAVP